MIQAFVSTATRWLHDLGRVFLRDQVPAPELFPPPAPSRTYQPLERVVLTDQVCRTLFEDFAQHRQTPRGEEETGWVLLGVREEKEAIVLATLPAGAARQAGVAHVRFNSDAQALASRMVRQWDKRLHIVGVVHTHPGSLRHPSDGDYRGDSLWVGKLRGGEGIFGIGTADATPMAGTRIAQQPRSHVQCLDDLCFSWYALGRGQRNYRRLPLRMTVGPDLARPLHAAWPTMEKHAVCLERLCRQQAGLTLQIIDEPEGPFLGVNMTLAEPGHGLRVLLRGDAVHYYLNKAADLIAVDPKEKRVDRGVYLVLAELASHT